MERVEGDCAVLDCGAGVCAVRADYAEAEVNEMARDLRKIKVGTPKLVEKYARLWPSEIFDYVTSKPGKRLEYLAKSLPVLRQPGVYVLYRDDVPYYVGKASNWLWHRLHVHARKPGGRYNNFWNHFSVFVIHDPGQRDAVESILIAAFPTANSAKPKIDREPMPKVAIEMWRQRRDVQLDSTRAKHADEEVEKDDEEE